MKNGIIILENFRREGSGVFFSQKTILTEKIKESLASVLPVTGIVMLLLVTIVPIDAPILLSFLLGAVMLILGMGLFTLGADVAMMPMGEYVGSRVTKTKKLWIVILVSFFVGVMITMSEPDLTVLANQISSIPSFTLIIAVAVGVGFMLVIAMLRIIFNVKLKYLLLGFYAVVFILAFLVPESFLAISFDSGGVTTGPMTVPFIMSLGVGVASIRADEETDSFGLIALCSVGPIIAVMMLGLLNDVDRVVPEAYVIPTVTNSRDIFWNFATQLPHYALEVGIAIGPIVLFFLIFRALTGGIGTKGLGKILVGVLYTFLGLTLFLTGVNVGFMPLGNLIGANMASSALKWLIVPIGMIIGYFIVAAEPAVHVLTKQVEDETSGTIPGKVLSVALSFGVAISVGIAMLRVLLGIPVLYVLIPGYAIALILSFVVPDIFTSIAFDSGGVASGPMTATFLLPFAVGACSALGGNIAEDAFGVVAMVAMTPLIAIQILGLVYKIKHAAAHKEEQAPAETVVTDSEGQLIMDLDAIEQISIADENADSVADDDEDIIDF